MIGLSGLRLQGSGPGKETLRRSGTCANRPEPGNIQPQPHHYQLDEEGDAGDAVDDGCGVEPAEAGISAVTWMCQQIKLANINQKSAK